MSAPADEFDAAIEMALDQADCLRAKNPQHELLKFIEGTWTPDVHRRFHEQFGGEKIPDNCRDKSYLQGAALWCNYYEALRAAVAA